MSTHNTNTRHTVTDMLPAIGALVSVRCQDLVIDCRVIDAKNSWGKTRLLVAPVAGRGQQWIELERLVRPEAAVQPTAPWAPALAR